MADLDDFFAKKDKKKSKGKKYATTYYEIAKKLEESGKKTEKLKKDKLQSSQEVDEQGNAVQDEDEWREFEEEKKDYTGLKIQNLTLAEYDSGEDGCSGEDEGGLEENEAGELVPRKKQTGPWRAMQNVDEKLEEQSNEAQQQQQQQHLQQQQAAVTTSNTTSAAATTTTSTTAATTTTTTTTNAAYVPPALRNQAKQMPFNPRLKRKVAPDVRSEELFPTLSAANTQEPTTSAWGKKKGGKEEGIAGGGGVGATTGGGGAGFEEVRNSKSHTARYEPPHLQNKQLALGNKYDALENEQS